MLSRVNLIAILLTLNCVGHAREYSGSSRVAEQRTEEGAVTSGRKVNRYTYDNATSEYPASAAESRVGEDKLTNKMDTEDDEYNTYLDTVEERVEPRKKKRMSRAVLALLMAYKLKFIALIPTLLGGLILLKGTTLLAGFFFALFAATLGLKIHP